MNASPPPIAILDFDHTLFKTEEFWTATREALHTLYGLNPDQLERERLDRGPGGPGRLAGGEGYDLFEHLRTHYQLDATTARADLTATLRGPQWLYDGAPELLNLLDQLGYTTAVITVGIASFQTFKRDCSVGLPAHVTFEVVERNKGKHLAEQWQSGQLEYRNKRYQSAVIVDDAASTFESLGQRPGLTAIQIVGRPKYPVASTLPWVKQIHSLRDIPALISAQA